MKKHYDILCEKRTGGFLYTDSLAEETAFHSALWNSCLSDVKDNEAIAVSGCPKCRKGTVFSKRVHEVTNGLASWHYDHICDRCGEKFDRNAIGTDIFFHKEREVLDRIRTPFGDLRVKVNGIAVPFHCRTAEALSQENTGEQKPFTTYDIEIDMLRLKPGTKISIGFDSELLEFEDSDEHTTLYTCEDGNTMLGLCAYEPFEPYEEDFDSHCYVLDDYSPQGFTYRIISDPKKQDVNAYLRSRVLPISAAWVDKAELDEPATELFLSLTW